MLSQVGPKWVHQRTVSPKGKSVSDQFRRGRQVHTNTYISNSVLLPSSSVSNPFLHCDLPALKNKSLRGPALLKLAQTRSLGAQPAHEGSALSSFLTLQARSAEIGVLWLEMATVEDLAWHLIRMAEPAAWPGQLLSEVGHRWPHPLSTTLWVSHLPSN